MWYRSASFNECHRPVHVDHQLTSVYQVADDGAIFAVCPARARAVGERDFSAREQRLLDFFVGELGPLVGRSLVSLTEPNPAQLSPRLRQTLASLLEGDGERQIAERLGLTRATVHQYVTALYRHFRVRSRAQLMAYALKRGGWGVWRELPRDESATIPRTRRP